MGKQVSRWVSDDGQEFAEQRDMLLHELSLVDAKEIELFVQSKPTRKRTEYQNVLKEWQAYQRLQEVEAKFKPIGEFNFSDFPVPMVGVSQNPLDDLFDGLDDSFDRATSI